MNEYFVLFVSEDAAELAGLHSTYLTQVGEFYATRLRIPVLPWNVMREAAFYMAFDANNPDYDRLRKARSKYTVFLQQHIQKAIDLNIPSIRISE